mgnify:CR=1 FL=1
MSTFLADKNFIPVPDSGIPNTETIGLTLGNGLPALEIIVITSKTPPSATALRNAWKERQGGRPAPVLLVVVYEDKASVCGPSGDNPPVISNINSSQLERVCSTALEEPERHSAMRFLRPALEALESPMAGLRNEGLLASNELAVWLRERKDLNDARSRSHQILASRDTSHNLMSALGFEVQQLPGPAAILISESRNLALAIFLDRNESPDTANQRFDSRSPITYALTEADQKNLPYIIVSHGPALRIYPTNPGTGVGRRGRTETFLELHLDTISEDHLPLLWYLFSSEALGDNGTFKQLLERSKRFATSLGERLRERVYQQVVPSLATAILNAQSLGVPTQQDLDQTHRATLTLLFRILFVAYGEDKDLLPYKTNELYRAHSLKQKAQQLITLREQGNPFDEHSYSHWNETVRLFEAVDKGSTELTVPAYNGGLFSDDPAISETGALLSTIRLTSNEFGPALSYILIDDGPEGVGAVDFRSLGVREFGTIYEGLLESELSLADQNLIIDKNGNYGPAGDRTPEILTGEVYIHNKSGARKSSGSYFTKAFAVDHLLDHSLEPALTEHTTRLGEMEDVEAGKAFFDFRVADIAMGSGHFLVAAVDRIERRLQQYLAERPLPAVIDELTRLRQSAVNALGVLADGVEIEDTTLLRRQIARRCIYGVDLNPTAVELARVSLWIHTFVPGLPLSMLDHHLVQGNSLVGIGTMEEAQELVSKATGGPLFNVFVEKIVRSAAQSMAKVGNLADADAAEIHAARGALREARLGIDPLKAMFDILTASRLDANIAREVSSNVFGWQDKPEEILGSNLYRSAIEVMVGIEPFHFPVTFPDVFARSRVGFDVILGNPPWEEATIEELGFWARHFPGLKGIPQREREARIPVLRYERKDLARLLEAEVQENLILRKALTTGPFPGMGTGDPDLYKAFCWRFWYLLHHSGGHLGVVLPRSVWSVLGSEDFRKAVLTQGEIEDLTFLLNTRNWVFDMEPRYTIALTSLAKRPPNERSVVATRGPYPTLMAFNEGIKEPPSDLTSEEILSWTDTAAVPLLTSKGAKETGEAFRRIRLHPSLGDTRAADWRVRPYGELHATNDKNLMRFTTEAPQGLWPVFKGASFGIWSPDNGPNSYYAWSDPETLRFHLYEKRLKAAKGKDSPFSEFPDAWLQDRSTLPCLKPRIAFRDIARATDTRTVIPSLLPPNVFLTNKAPYCLRPLGTEQDEAFLLGVLSSIPLDWYARRIVELSLNFFVFNGLPIPRPNRNHSLWQRVVSLSGRLASPDERFADWASAVGVEYGPLDQDEKENMIHELDAAVAHMYGLSESQLIHIFETFHVGWDYHERLQRTLEHFQNLN